MVSSIFRVMQPSTHSILERFHRSKKKPVRRPSPFSSSAILFGTPFLVDSNSYLNQPALPTERLPRISELNRFNLFILYLFGSHVFNFWAFYCDSNLTPQTSYCCRFDVCPYSCILKCVPCYFVASILFFYLHTSLDLRNIFLRKFLYAVSIALPLPRPRLHRFFMWFLFTRSHFS